jgi:dTDP-glucose pyrophosphorylase
MKYVFQEEQKGLVHAMEQTQEALEGDDFILLLADEILIDPKPMEMIQKFTKDNLFVMCGVTRVKDLNEIKKTYAMIYHPDTNEIYRLIEKPRNPINDLMGTGNCIFKNEIFDYIAYTPINYFREEKELPDLIQCAIDDGKAVQLFHIGARYVNINTPEDIRKAEALFNGV